MRDAMTSSGRLLRPLLVGLLGAAGVAAFLWLDPARLTSVDMTRALVESHPPYGPLIFMALVIGGIMTQLPMLGFMLIAIGGVLFRGLPAFAYGWLASLVGTSATFLLVRSVRGPVHRLLYERYARVRALDDRLARNGFWTVLVLRLAGGLAPPLNWGLGLTGVGIRDYVAGTALGVIPGIALAVFFADAIATRAPGSGGVSLVTILRGVSLLAFGGPMLMGLDRRARETGETSPASRGSRWPLAANLASFALFFPSLFLAAGPGGGALPLFLAGAGSLVAVAGAGVVRRARDTLGAAWSFVPLAATESGVVSTGPYRLVRHPIYLGLSMLAAGEAIAFDDGPALLAVLVAVIPTFLWRARTEEALLTHVFGDVYRGYRERTKMMLPYLL